MVSSSENSSSSSSITAPKVKSPDGCVSPLQLNAFLARGPYPRQYRHPNLDIFDPYASPESRSFSPRPESPLVNYLRWSSGSSGIGSGVGWSSGSGRRSSGSRRGSLSSIPLTSIDNIDMSYSRSPTVFRTPMRVEEDVVVIDGILINHEQNRKSKGSAGQRMKSPSSFGGRLSSSSSSSGGKENSNSHKMKKCRSWDDSGTCRFGSNCLFGHAMEEQHGKSNLTNYKSELCKAVTSVSCSDGEKSHVDSHKETASPSLVAQSPLASVRSVEVTHVSPIEPERTTNDHNSNATNSSAHNDWCPPDDGIQMALSSASSDDPPSRDAINAYIQSVLYGLSQRERLPVFAEICPE